MPFPPPIPNVSMPPLPITNPPPQLNRAPPPIVQPPALPNKPLFPAAIAGGNLIASSLNEETIKSELKTNGTAAVSLNSNNETINLIANPTNGKIMHPEEDLSLEELRIRLPKYRLKFSSSSSISNLMLESNLPLSLNNLNVVNNYSRQYSNDNLNDNSISQPCYTTPINNEHARNYYRKT